jgi:uncharacterized protein YcnI
VKNKLVIVAAGVIASLAIAGPAWAHVTVQPSEGIADSFSAFVVRVPNERDNASTTKIQLQFPTLTSVSFQDVAGWTRQIKMKKLDEPIEVFGEPVTEVVGTVTWSGGTIEPGEFAEFPFSAHLPAEETDLEFPAIQTYSNGEVVRWIGPADADEPAAHVGVLELGELGADVGQLGTVHNITHELEELTVQVEELQTAVDDQPATATDDEGDEEDSDTLPLILGIAGVALGLIALVVAISKRSA